MRNEPWGRRHPYAARMRTVADARLARYSFDSDWRHWKPQDLLREVVQRGNTRMLLSLLHQGVDPNERTEMESTPLFYAAEWDKPAMVSLLLRYGAAPNLTARDIWGDSYVPLMHRSRTLITRRLLYHGANPRARTAGGITPLHTAASGGTYGSVELLIDWGADVNAATVEGETSLIYAVGWNNELAPLRIRIMELLLARGANLNARDDYGRTALLHAAHEGNAPVMRFLLAQGANLGDRDTKGRDALDQFHKYFSACVLASLC